MFRFFLLIIVVFAVVVFMRLVLLRLKFLEMKAPPPASSSAPAPRTIDAPQPLEIKSYMFANFDYRTGPPDPDEFFENLFVNVGEAESDISLRAYSFYVATPKALSFALREKNQDYRFGRNLLVVE